MFSRISAFSVLALTLLAVATPNPQDAKRWGSPPTTTTLTVTAPAPTVTSARQCNTGDIQCCESTEPASSDASTLLLGFLGIVLSDLDVLVGLSCSPVTAIGVGSGSACDASPVCCENNSFGSAISIGCAPIIL